MEQPELEVVVRNIDVRLVRVEQILPTLATKDDLREAIAPLPTRVEMRDAIQAAVAKAVEPLPTRAEMRSIGV